MDLRFAYSATEITLNYVLGSLYSTKSFAVFNPIAVRQSALGFEAIRFYLLPQF